MCAPRGWEWLWWWCDRDPLASKDPRIWPMPYGLCLMAYTLWRVPYGPSVIGHALLPLRQGLCVKAYASAYGFMASGFRFELWPLGRLRDDNGRNDSNPPEVERHQLHRHASMTMQLQPSIDDDVDVVDGWCGSSSATSRPPIGAQLLDLRANNASQS